MIRQRFPCLLLPLVTNWWRIIQRHPLLSWTNDGALRATTSWTPYIDRTEPTQVRYVVIMRDWQPQIYVWGLRNDKKVITDFVARLESLCFLDNRHCILQPCDVHIVLHIPAYFYIYLTLVPGCIIPPKFVYLKKTKTYGAEHARTYTHCIVYGPSVSIYVWVRTTPVNHISCLAKRHCAHIIDTASVVH